MQNTVQVCRYLVEKRQEVFHRKVVHEKLSELLGFAVRDVMEEDGSGTVVCDVLVGGKRQTFKPDEQSTHCQECYIKTADLNGI